MNIAQRSLVAAIAVLISACAAWDIDKSVRKVDLDDEAKYVRTRCGTDPMVGYKSGLKVAIDAKYKELESASGNLSAERYRALSQKLEGYTAKAQILHDEQYQRCTVYQTCMYREGIQNSNNTMKSCDNYDSAVKETADRIRDALSEIEDIKAT